MFYQKKIEEVDVLKSNQLPTNHHNYLSRNFANNSQKIFVSFVGIFVGLFGFIANSDSKYQTLTY